jgi:alkanesulfonate monooxygenase SsuD/methylene tetrahydromethanopterin reductase-like flavin-dependent oxidoreductase (luciferase family)
MGDPAMGGAQPLRGEPDELAEQLDAFARAGAAHVMLVVDPITQPSIEWLGQVIAALG